MLILYFDYPSPAAAVAVLRLHSLVRASDAVSFTGLDVLGLDGSIPPTLDQLAQIDRHRERARGLGLELRRPTRRPSTTSAHLVGELADDLGLGRDWRQACLHAYWRDDADLGDPGVLTELAVLVGLDVGIVTQLLGDRKQHIHARQRAAQRRRRGIGDVPVIEVDGTFVGTDLADDELRALAAL